MKNVLIAALGALFAIAVVGCGGSGPEAAKGKSELPTPSAASEPTPVETESCKSTTEPLLDIFEVMRTEASGRGMDPSALQVRFEKLQDVQDAVRAACTDAVYAPYSMAVYELALVNAKMLVCDTAAACRKAGVPEHMQKALDQEAKIQTALEAAR